MTEMLEGYFLKRYKRFFADVILNNNEHVTVYCPNTGRLTTCLEENAPVLLSKSSNPNRKLKLTLEYIYTNNTWICINTQKANPIIEKALKTYTLDPFKNYDTIKPEIPINKCRFDFGLFKNKLLTDLIEVKAVTYCKDDTYLFPDAPTIRGQKQLNQLIQCQKDNIQCHVIFLAMRQDANQFKPANHIDEHYTNLLQKAAKNGVKIHCFKKDLLNNHTTPFSSIPIHIKN